MFLFYYKLLLLGACVESLFADEYQWTATTPETGVRVARPDGSYVTRGPIRGMGAAIFESWVKDHVRESLENHGIGQAQVEIKFRGRVISYEYRR